MPELPEVETIARKLRNVLLNRRFEAITVLWAKTIANIDPVDFIQKTQDTTVNAIGRRGKFLIFDLDNDKNLVIHLRMSGKFSIHPAGDELEVNKHTRVRMLLDNGLLLNYIDQRKFGRFYLVDDANTITSKLGPEPLSHQFSVEWLNQNLSRRTAQLKTLLLNQSFIAGLGNIYASEALWDARINPYRKANSLTQDEVFRLHKAIVEVLQMAINHGGTTLDDRQYVYPDGKTGLHQLHLHVYDRAGETCERCGFQLERVVQAQRSTYYCPTCQSSLDV